MSQGSLNQALDDLAEETTQKIIFTLQPGATSDPLPAVKRLLLDFWDQAQEQLSQEALGQQSEEGVEVKLLCEETVFYTYRTPYIPRTGELVRCQLTIGKGHLATLWQVKEIEHGVGEDRLGDVTISVQPADTQTAMHWKRYPRERHTSS